MIINANSILQHVIQIKKWNNETYQYECILHTLLIAIILLLILTMICYYYAKNR